MSYDLFYENSTRPLDERDPVNTAMVLAHPGHELRVLGWVKRNSPFVAILTDGSGSSQIPRIKRSAKILTDLGCEMSTYQGLYTDKQIYDHLKQPNSDLFWSFLDSLAHDWKARKVTKVVSDMREGYSPTHDLVQALTQLTVRRCEQLGNGSITHWTFPLTGVPGACPNGSKPRHVLELETSDFTFKLETARAYEELAHELAVLEERGSLEVFRQESFFQVDQAVLSDRYLTETPYYEEYGRRQIEKGIYKDLLTYREHLRPVLLELETRLGS